MTTYLYDKTFDQWLRSNYEDPNTAKLTVKDLEKAFLAGKETQLSEQYLKVFITGWQHVSVR